MSKSANAAIYCRISRDPEGLRHGVERQQEDCEALARKQGLNVVATYVDNDIGASSLSRSKRRPQYEAMLEAARDGDFDVVLAYSNSRLTRRLMELEDLIRLHDERGTKIRTVVSGEDNLSTADGRMVARIKASVDAAEAERTGERLRRGMLQRARRGDTNKGQRAFGWSEDKIALHPVEAPLLRKAVDDIIDGVALRQITREWSAAGVVSTYGNTWIHSQLRRALKKPRLMGVATHQGEILFDAAGEPIRGEWEPLIDHDTWDRLQAALDARVRGGKRPEARRYLLSGLTRCSECGGRMYGMKTPTAYAYTCQQEPLTHSVTIQGPKTEQVILALAEARLADEDLEAAAPATPEPTSTSRLDQIPGLITELMEAFKSGQVSGAIVFPQIETLEAERTRLQAERQRYLARTATPSPVGAEDLAGLEPDRQRAILETIFEAVVISPAERRGAPWTPDRIRPVWRAT